MRLGKPEDYYWLLPLLHDFVQNSSYKKLTWNQEKVSRKLLEALQKNGKEVIIIVEENSPGFIMGHIQVPSFSDSKLAVELAWWANDKKTTVKLFRAFEYWAEHIAKADFIHCASFNSSDRKNFQKCEQHYIRKIN